MSDNECKQNDRAADIRLYSWRIKYYSITDAIQQSFVENGSCKTKRLQFLYKITNGLIK